MNRSILDHFSYSKVPQRSPKGAPKVVLPKCISVDAPPAEACLWFARCACGGCVARFKADPKAFAPQYGGYCAWAVAMGKLAPGRPDHWHVVNGKLYLNYSTRVKKRWDALRREFIRDANDNWPELLDE